jgi:hypothetical protein
MLHILSLTLILLTWRIWWAPNNARKWQMGFNLALKGLVAVEQLLFIKSQFTTDVRNALRLRNCTHGHFWSWPAANFQKSRGGRKLFERRQNCVGEECVHSQSDLSTVRILSAPTEKNLKGLGSARCWILPRKLFAGVCWYEPFSFYFF